MSNSSTTDQQSRRIIREQLLTNILVEAGAGSGKTQMLAERMAAGVATGNYSIEHLAAVTFTRKAASELRGRFHLALEQELGSEASALDPKRSARIRAALSNLERFFAGTIHAFCARLLRERPVESGVSPGFTELDEIQDLELRQRVWRDFISKARSEGDAEMIALMEADLRPSDLDPAFATICANDDVDFPPGDAQCPDPRPAFQALDAFWQALQEHLPSAIKTDTTCKIQQAAQEFNRRLRVSRRRLDRPATIASLLEIWDCHSKIVQMAWSNSAQEKRRLRDLIEGMHREFRDTVVSPYLAQWRQYIYRLSIILLTRARDHAVAERRRLNSLNYGDLLNLTARVLREDQSVRRALQQKFQHVLVDEFQDTDPVQAEIVFWLAEDGDTSSPAAQSAERDWRKVPLRPGALFVVGDPKQSIYRFRRADIDIYNIVRQRFSDPAVGLVVPLTMNYRSVPQLCNWANRIFENIFPPEPTAHAPRFAALDANRKDIAPVSIFALTHSCDSKEVQQYDPAFIAAYIRSEVDAGRRHFSDFLILTRKKRNRIAPYAQALEALNIPVEVSGAGAFGESAEVRALTVLLRALADPQDSLSLIAVLRGPLFGISDPELFAFKQAGGWFTLFYEPENAVQPLKIHSALAALRQYHRWTRLLPAPGALERVLEHTGYLALASTSPGGVDAGDLIHAIDRVRQVVEEGGSLADAADAFEGDNDAASEIESLPLEPGRTDIVRLMNLHKAKGLEAAVVFLADPCGGVKPRVDVHIERTGLSARGWLKISRRSETSFAEQLLGIPADWSTHEAEEMPYLEAEENRLLYVAATRARDAIVVSRTLDAPRTPAWGVLNTFLLATQELMVPGQVDISLTQPLNSPGGIQAAAEAAQRAKYATAIQPSWLATSVTAEARHIAAMSHTVEASTDDPSKVVTTDTPSHRADAGLAWGTLIHGLLEHAMRYRQATAADLHRLALWLSVEEPQLRPVLDQAVNTVLEVSRAEFWQRAVERERSVETPFTHKTGDIEVVSGVVDLMFREDSRWHIIDYKTDLKQADTFAAYAQQLKMYERALASVGIEGTTAEIQPVREKPAVPR